MYQQLTCPRHMYSGHAPSEFLFDNETIQLTSTGVINWRNIYTIQQAASDATHVINIPSICTSIPICHIIGIQFEYPFPAYSLNQMLFQEQDMLDTHDHRLNLVN